jgi:probable rRNA maturation factor
MITADLNQQILRGGQKLPLSVLGKILKYTSKELQIKKKHHISIAFVDKKTIKRLNNTYRGKDYVTDVLSFILKEDGLLGEIVVSYDKAKEQAKEFKHSTRDEVVFLIVHGILHLFGYDHEVDSDAQKMYSKQGDVLKKFKINSRI